MMSVMPSHAYPPLHGEEHPLKDVKLNELGNLKDALEPFAEMLSRSGRSVRLHCTVPTMCPSSDVGVDLHDLQALRTRSLVFVHELIEALRALGVRGEHDTNLMQSIHATEICQVTASYRLQPSSCPLCLVCALPPELDANKVKAAALAAVQHAQPQLKEKALFANLEDGLALIIT